MTRTTRRFIGATGLACVACCIGPIVALLGAISAATIAGVLLVGAGGSAIGLLAIPALVHRRRRRNRLAGKARPVPVPSPTPTPLNRTSAECQGTRDSARSAGFAVTFLACLPLGRSGQQAERWGPGSVGGPVTLMTRE